MRPLRCLVKHDHALRVYKSSPAVHLRSLCPAVLNPNQTAVLNLRNPIVAVGSLCLGSRLHFTPLPTALRSCNSAKALQQRAFSDSNPVNNSASSASLDLRSTEEIVASGIRLLQDKDPGAAVQLLQPFENSDNVLALSALGRSLVAAAESLNEADSGADHSELALQLKHSIRKLARANTTGKSGGCRSSTIDPESVSAFISRGLTCLQKAVRLGNDAASQTALANHAVALFQRGQCKDLGPALSLYESAGVAGDADAWYAL